MKKKLTDNQKVAIALVDISEAIKKMEATAKGFDTWIDKAAILGEDDYSNQLIVEKLDVLSVVDDLKFVELQITKNSSTANAFSSLKKLPIAISACKSLLKEQPNLSKVGSDLMKFSGSLTTATDSLKSLRSEMTRNKLIKTDQDLLSKNEFINSPKYKNEVEARNLRLMNNLNQVKEEKNVSTIIDIDQLIAEENKKN